MVTLHFLRKTIVPFHSDSSLKQQTMTPVREDPSKRKNKQDIIASKLDATDANLEQQSLLSEAISNGLSGSRD